MNVTAPRFVPRTPENAPEGAGPILEGIRKGYGFVPNLMATFANSPVVLQGYLALDAQFEKSGFTPAERQLILLTASVANECEYCAAAHSTIAKGMLHVAGETVAAVRNGSPLEDPKLEALVSLVRELIERRGHATPETVSAFLEAGYAPERLLEINLGIALKTISNYVDGLAHVEIDPAFASEARR